MYFVPNPGMQFRPPCRPCVACRSVAGPPSLHHDMTLCQATALAGLQRRRHQTRSVALPEGMRPSAALPPACSSAVARPRRSFMRPCAVVPRTTSSWRFLATDWPPRPGRLILEHCLFYEYPDRWVTTRQHQSETGPLLQLFGAPEGQGPGAKARPPFGLPGLPTPCTHTHSVLGLLHRPCRAIHGGVDLAARPFETPLQRHSG